MNETLKAIATRYSCRDYAEKPVDKELLQAIAEAAVQSPSAMNNQPWHIIVITDKELITALFAGRRVLPFPGIDAASSKKEWDSLMVMS